MSPGYILPEDLTNLCRRWVPRLTSTAEAPLPFFHAPTLGKTFELYSRVIKFSESPFSRGIDII